MLIPLFSLALALLADRPSSAAPTSPATPFVKKLRLALGAIRDWSARQPPPTMSLLPALSDAIGRSLGDSIGMPVLGVGSGRIAFDLGDGRVLKVAYNAYGQAGNRLEVQRWSQLQHESEIAPLLFPVLDHDARENLWLVMPKSEGRGKETTPDLQRAIASWEHEYGDEFPTDSEWFNWGWLEGRWRLLDYGQQVPEDMPPQRPSRRKEKP